MLLPENRQQEKARHIFFFFFFGENNRFLREMQAGLIQCAKTSSININKRLL